MDNDANICFNLRFDIWICLANCKPCPVAIIRAKKTTNHVKCKDTRQHRCWNKEHENLLVAIHLIKINNFQIPKFLDTNNKSLNESFTQPSLEFSDLHHLQWVGIDHKFDFYLFRNLTKDNDHYIFRKENVPLCYSRMRELFIQAFKAL
jgi:hypothetical protein